MSAYYSFLPYIRQGLAGEITEPDDIYNTQTATTQDRVSLPINVTVQETSISGTTTPATISQPVKLKGPGDIIGINSSQIVKVFPKDWTTNFEPNYLPYIEFYDEDFPWRYTPSKSVLDTTINENAFRLRPWLSLVVLKETEFTDETFKGPLASISVNASGNGAFHSEAQTWAWAHVHVNEGLGTGYAPLNPSNPSSNIDPSSVTSNITSSSASGSLINKLKANPDIAVSRIMCPRELEPNTGYHAFLIPTFEIGRKAGLGQAVAANADRMEPSWIGTTVQKSFPVYYRWFFKTGAGGDFESLVRLLKPRIVGNDVGKRAVDLQLPGNPLLETLTVNNGTPDTVGLQGVLKPVGQAPDAWSNGSPFSAALKTIVNSPAAAQSGSPDPIIGPPIYGHWHVQLNTINGTPTTSDWINTVNQDPRYRIFAGIGAEVVRKNQDKYMAIAWEQIGEVMEANRKLRQMQLAMQASQVLHDKHIKTLGSELVVNISGPVHARILETTAKTVYKEVADSNMPNAMFSGAFRRMTNPGSPLVRGLASNGVAVNTASIIADVNVGNAATAFAYTAPSGMATLTAMPAAAITAAAVATLTPVSSFSLSAPGSMYATAVYGAPSSSATAFTGSLTPTFATVSAVPAYSFPSGTSLTLSNTSSNIKLKLEPKSTVFELAQKQVRFIDPITLTPTQITKLEPVQAAPKITLPMYRELVDISTDWLMPGLNTIPDNSISLLEMNQDHIEAFMLGANYEMARELAWRGYPTDQRGTYFSFFWGYSSSLSTVPTTGTSLNNYRDIYDIHDWKTPSGGGFQLTMLGQNSPRLNSLGSNVTMLILTIRGELFRRYPGARVFLHKAEWTYDSSTTPPTPYLNRPRQPVTGSANEIYPVFSAEISPDVYFLGFPVDAATIKGHITDDTKPGYFFVFQEQAGEVKFGADENPGVTYTAPILIAPDPASATPNTGDWNNLNWGHIKAAAGSNYKQFIDPTSNIDLGGSAPVYPESVKWGRNSASMAFTLLQLPVKLYVHAKELIA